MNSNAGSWSLFQCDVSMRVGGWRLFASQGVTWVLADGWAELCLCNLEWGSLRFR